jgi:hypothetical protein
MGRVMRAPIAKSTPRSRLPVERGPLPGPGVSREIRAASSTSLSAGFARAAPQGRVMHAPIAKSTPRLRVPVERGPLPGPGVSREIRAGSRCVRMNE